MTSPFVSSGPRRRSSVRTAIASPESPSSPPCLRLANGRGVLALTSQRKENTVPTVPRPPLTPRRRALLTLFDERYTLEEQIDIRFHAEAHGIDFLEDLVNRGRLDPRQLPPEKGKRNR